MEKTRFLSAKFFAKTLIVSGMVLVFGVTSASALVKVGFVDMQKAITTTKSFKRSMTKYQTSYKSEQTKIQAKEEAIKKKKDELEKQKFVMSPDLVAKKEEQWRNDYKDFKRYVQDKNESFQRTRDEMGRQILVKMMAVVKKLGKEKKFTVILENKSVLYNDSTVDLTDIVVKRFDALHK
jgi:outer membrane protein